MKCWHLLQAAHVNFSETLSASTAAAPISLLHYSDIILLLLPIGKVTPLPQIPFFPGGSTFLGTHGTLSSSWLCISGPQ